MDGRGVNRMDPETKRVHLRLEAWGKWAKELGIQGYPSQSPIEKAALYGKLGIPQESNYRGEPEIPIHIAHTDVAVAKLPPQERIVIRCYYIYWEPVESLASRSHMKVRKFQSVLMRARWRVHGYLDAIEEIR